MTLPELLPPFSGSVSDTDFTSAVPKFGFRSKRVVLFCRFVVCFVVAPSLKRFRLVAGSSSPQFSNSQFLSVVQEDISGRGVWVLLQMIVNNFIERICVLLQRCLFL